MPPETASLKRLKLAVVPPLFSTYLKLNHLAKNEETGQTRGQKKKVRRKKEAGKAGIKKSKVLPPIQLHLPIARPGKKHVNNLKKKAA